jgi:outer membrane scaffolding protein for murein synthesis (MipA/OmpV family)
MNNKKRFLCAAISCLALSASAADKQPLPLWEAGVGAGWLSTPAYPGANTQSERALVLPFLIYRGEILRSDQQGIGARLLRSDAAEFDIGFAASLPAHSTDVATRRGMPDLGTLVEFGPRLKLKLADVSPDERMRLELPLRAVIEVRGGLRRQGWTLEPRLVYEHREEDAWTWEAQLGVLLGDERINRYFYEVRPEFATPTRPGYGAQSGLMLVRTGVFAYRKLDPDWRVFGFLRYETYAGAANRNSPLMKKPTGASVGIGLAWTLARSHAPAHD